jgi:hypothetical protein
MITIDPITRQRILREKRVGDINYDLISDSPAIQQEDVPIVGPWSDWTGSASIDSRNQQMWGGITNALQGTDPQIIENAKLPKLTVRGNRQETNRQRVIKRNVL